ncbi:hypothetical protein ACQZV8_18055 [Magnetococcales bacterium HHB-1]
MSREPLYSDGTENISIAGGVVRIDLFAYAPPKDEQGKERRDFQQRVIMSPEAFLQSYNAMNRVMTRLQEQGLVTQKQADKASEPAKKGDDDNATPNF